MKVKTIINVKIYINFNYGLLPNFFSLFEVKIL